MRDPLGDEARERLTDEAAEFLTERGFDVERPETRAEPPAVARREGHAFGVEPLTLEEATPTTVASRIGHAIERDRRVLFVVGDDLVADELRDLLAPPRLLRGTDGGMREFHAGPDRIPLREGGYACVEYDGLKAPEFRWRESATPVGPVPATEGVDAGATAVEDDVAEPVVPRLVCDVSGRPAVVLGGTASLQTPPAAAVPYRYSRDADDKQFRVVRTDDGAVVERFGGFAGLKHAGYHPVPMPLVPEHVFGPDVDVGEAWVLLQLSGEPRLYRDSL